MTVLLAGASGVLGRHLTTALQNAGHQVLSLGRGPGNDVRADLLDRAGLLEAVRGRHAEIVVHAATALRKPPLRAKDMAATNALRIEGTRNLLEAAKAIGAQKIVSESMVFGYGFGDLGSAPLTEKSPFGLPETEVQRALGVKEKLTSAAGGVSLRFGLFYGPGGTEELVAMLRKRMLPVVRSTNVLPWVDLRDAAAAVVAAIEHGRPGAAYNIADDTPMSFGDHVGVAATAFGTPKPMTVPLWLLKPMSYLHTMLSTDMRVDTSAAHRELGWSPRLRSATESLRDMAS